MPKTAPFSSSVAFLTPPTFPAPAPRKRFFDPLPKKILGFRTRKGRPPRRQYLARARLEFRAGLRVVVSSRARAFGISCGLLAGGAGGGLAALPTAGAGRRPADRLPAVPTRRPHRSRPTRPPAVGLPICRRDRLPRRSAALPTAGAGRRPADRLPAVPTRRPHRSRPTRPPAVGLPICRRDRLPRRSADLPLGRPEPPPRVFTAPGIVPG